MTKTKFALCGIAACVVASFGLSMCSDKDKAPLSPEAIKTAAMYKCSGFFEYLGQNTPNMPVEMQAMHQEMAVGFYKLAGNMSKGANITSSMDNGRDLAKEHLKTMDRKSIGEQMQICKDAAKIEMDKQEQSRPVTDTSVDKDMPVPNKEEEARNKILLQKQQREEHSKTLFQCAGIFMYNAQNIPGVSEQNKAQQMEWGMNSYKLAEHLDKQVDAKIWGMKGAQKAEHLVLLNDLQGMKSEMEECAREIKYVMENKSKLGI